MMTIMMIMVVIGMMIMIKINFLSGTIAKKTQGSETKNKGRTSAHCLASRSCDGLLHVRRREEALEVTDSCF